VGKLDSLLGGGWAVGRTNVIYGPASSLKTTICIATSLLFTSRGGIVFYLDTEGKTYPERLRGAVYRESRDVNTLLNHLAEIASRMRYLNPSLVLVVVDSLSAPFHGHYLSNPGYAREKHSSLNHYIRSITSMGATALLTSWQLRGSYIGKSLEPAIVVRTSKHGRELKVYLEKSPDTLIGQETLSVEEVVESAAL